MAKLGRTLIPLLGVLALTGCNRTILAEPIFLGHLAPLSGPERSVGVHAKQGILLAVEEVNREENRIAGRRVAVVHVDTGGDLEVLQREAIRLLTVNRVQALLGGTDLVQVERLARDLQQYGVPLVTPNGVPAKLAAENIISINVAPALRGQILARFATEELKATRAMVLNDSHSAATTALAAAFEKEFAKVSGNRVEEAAYKSEPERAELTRRSQSDPPDVVLFAGKATELAKLRGQLREAGLKARVLFGGEEGSLATLTADAEAGHELYLATAYVATGKNGSSRGQEFAKKYEQRFHEVPDYHAALAYESVHLLAEAMRRLPTPTGPKLREELVLTDKFESLTGPLTIRTDHYARRAVYVVRLDKGQVVVAKAYDG
jgi:branched-chain amino acid transport system substrate-binding protein